MRKLALLLHESEVTFKEYVKIKETFNDVEELEKKQLELRKIVSEEKSKLIIANIQTIEKDIIQMDKMGVDYIICSDEKFPDTLRHIAEPPYLIYYMGNIELINKFSIAVIGSRKPTSYGIFAANKFAKELSERGIVIISGFAMGIDSESHRCVVNHGGETIGILGTSFDNMYPRSNIKFAKEMIEKNNLIITEYPLSKDTKPYHFVQRNRLISGLSQGLLVIEAGIKSGTLTTVDFALDQGKNIFAIPGNINSPNSIGTNNLIKFGAKMTLSCEDILEEYKNIDFETEKQIEKITFSETEKRIIDTLKKEGAQNIEKIAFFTNIQIKDIMGILNILEIKGVVKDLGNSIYSL
ncbi:MAG: DNA-processing protein DprA [Proteocatella sp.]